MLLIQIVYTVIKHGIAIGVDLRFSQPGLGVIQLYALFVFRNLFFWKLISSLFYVWQAQGKWIKENSIPVNKKNKT